MRRRRTLAAYLMALALVVAACAGTTGPSPSAASTPTPNPTPTPTASPTGSPAAATPTSSAAPTPSASTEACEVERQTIALPSDRFTSVVVTPGPDADLIAFAFGRPSLPGPPAPPAGILETATPPLTQAGSGPQIDLEGEHALRLRFTNMSLQNDVGQPTYDGDPEYKPDGQALRDLVLFDMSEGVVGWYIGYDGPGCVTLSAVRETVTVTIAHD
jgi:hypothetical protein